MSGSIGEPNSSNASAKSTLSLPVGNATGSGRNKSALRPGYSLMGWIRYNSSKSDLSGVEGPRQEVTMEELRKHDKPNDCWLCIRGKVYNVTEYMEYHPGGQDELMRGAGQDATQLFEDNHSYVNYEQLLQKCFVGRLAGSLL